MALLAVSPEPLLPRCSLPRPAKLPELTLQGAKAPRWTTVAMKLASLPMLVWLLTWATYDSPLVSSWVLSLSESSGLDVVGSVSPPEEAGWKRWLWWPIILYLFWGMAFVCDEYFVRTIDVISERFSIPDDVAGATLMALGCNGPELALNSIAIFHPSDIGIGAVVGGEVFNVLVIIGTALLATPSSYMPLKLGCFTFGRDVFFYALSVALLWWVLRDGSVTRNESAVLLTGAFCYILTVVMSEKLRTLLQKVRVRAKRSTIRASVRRSLRQGVSSFIRMNTPQIWEEGSEKLGDDEETDSLSESDEEPELKELWAKGFTCTNPRQGSVLGVRMDMRNRLMDRSHHYDNRFLCLGEDSLLLSTAKDPCQNHTSKCVSGMVYDYEGSHHHHWHHGGLVNQPVHLDAEASTPAGHEAEFLQNEHIKEMAVEIIPLEDILYVERPRDAKHFNLHVQHNNSELGGMVSLAFRASDEAVIDAWYNAFMVKLIALRRRTAGPPAEKSTFGLLKEWVEWLQFPVKFWLSVTIPNMERTDRQHLYPVAFMMSMFWLAVFAFSVIAACDGIHKDFGISTQILGFTVAAAGTSFPNVFSGMVVARQGKTSMAVANALGANVQNVFLALAIPWAIQSYFVYKGPFSMKVDNLALPILWCYITLLPVVAVFLCSSYSMPKWAGGFFLVVYVIYLTFALGEQISGQVCWPMTC